MSDTKDKSKDYEVGYGKPPVSAQMKPGETLNPGGKPVKSRNRLQGDFLRALADDFETHGKTAIVAMRTEKPSDYIRVVASLMPKEMEVSASTVLDEMSLEELESCITTVRAIVKAQEDASNSLAAD